MNAVPPSAPGLAPSGSTIASGIGGGLAAVGVFVLHLFGINLPAGIEAGIAAIITALAGYLPASGRK
jgi:hypothetical protein